MVDHSAEMNPIPNRFQVFGPGSLACVRAREPSMAFVITPIKVDQITCTGFTRAQLSSPFAAGYRWTDLLCLA